MRRLLATATLAASVVSVPGAHAAIPGAAPAVVSDPADLRTEGVDLRRVAFGQVATHLVLRLGSVAAWSSSQLRRGELCVVLVRRQAIGRLCVAARAGGMPAISFGRSRSGDLRHVEAAITRSGPRRLVARIAPHALGLRYGPIRWYAQSGADRAPDRGAAAARISAYGAPACFGAAARAARRCVNPALRTMVVPRPGAALLMHDGDCRPYPGRISYREIEPCEVGDVFGRRSAQIALIGDSHAAHLRAAVDVAAHARGWKAVMIAQPGCSFSAEVYARSPATCRRHSEEALAWLRNHPTIHTVITSSSAGRGLSSAGYLAIWRRIPRSVHRILVVRDVPRGTLSTARCVESVRRRRAPTRHACPVSRGAALVGDTSASAAAGAAGRVRLVDLTRHFCDASYCYPVVGGVYVLRDKDHINRLFSATLGPYLLPRGRL